MSDLISRKDVLHELGWCDYGLKDWQKWKLKMMVRDIPSAEPERKTGKWIHEGWEASYLRCSACGYRDYTEEHNKFCPNCGADMRCRAESEG